MATKVFYRCKKTINSNWVVGNEYAEVGGLVHGEDVAAFYPAIALGDTAFARIERDCFDAHGFEWFKHTPGDPMPNFATGKKLECLWSTGLIEKDGDDPLSPDFSENPHYWTAGGHEIIGWRYADSEQKKPVLTFSQAQDGTNWNAADFGVVPDGAQSNSPQPLSDGKLWPLGGLTFAECADRVIGHLRDDLADAMGCIVGVDFAQDPSERNDLIAAVDDGHLTPGQKAFIQGKEDAQAAKQQLKHDAEAKALQERADQLADAGKAMDRVNQGHDHRLGWMQ